MSQQTEQTGSLEAALKHAFSLVQTDPEMAIQQANEILSVAPDYPPAVLLTASAQRMLGNLDAALAYFKPLIRDAKTVVRCLFSNSLSSR